MNKSLQKWLKAAAIYNIVWGGITVFFPNLLFDLCQLPRPTYPEIWQCVGMIVGVYGVGYYAAARNYVIHWPIVLVGFMGKVAGPIGFIDALSRDRFNLAFGSTIIFNDLIWWIPFGLMLKEAWHAHRFR
jgi:small multidrug resistance pump